MSTYSYEMIDRYLRNNLGDDDYAEYSAALDSIVAPPKEEKQLEERSAEYWAEKFPCPLGYRLVKKTDIESDNPDFLTIPVEYQYHYPDGSWYCSNGESVNGMRPDRARSLYALKDSL